MVPYTEPNRSGLKWTTRYVESWLDHQTRRAVISSKKLGLSRVNIGANTVTHSVFTDDSSLEQLVESMER